MRDSNEYTANYVNNENEMSNEWNISTECDILLSSFIQVHQK